MVTNRDDSATLVWTLGDRLRKAREYAGLTQKELGETLGVARDSVRRWEGDKSVPHRPVLRMWAMRCGVLYEWLTGADGPHDGQNGTGSGMPWYLASAQRGAAA